MTTTVYPRFLGVDSNGDFVWELASGRWTWGDDPYQATRRQRTFTADRYLDKYGPVEPIPASDLLGHAPIPAEPEAEPVSAEAFRAAVAEAFEDGKKRGAEEARRLATVMGDRKEAARGVLVKILEDLDGWIEGARSNHDGMSHRGEPVGSECWTQYHPADIRSMVNDVAREYGLPEFPRPETPKEDEVR
jgi:hypothetical protein